MAVVIRASTVAPRLFGLVSRTATACSGLS
jgi:hypothetical protein